jgi:hypothetical protein
LHNALVGLLGSENVYFQPPSTVKMQYPCIVYKRSQIDTTYANDKPYNRRTRYSVTIIDPDPDSLIPDKVGKLPLSNFDRHFTADNLNHDVYNVYY